MKRLIDYLLASVILILVSPIFLIVALMIRINMGSPVFFRQERPGYKTKPFMLFKFRTMNLQYDANNQLLPDIERMTKLGNFLRKTSLDELPQLINILQGDMSFVGPRPLLMEYLPLYNAEQAKRHDVKPGITGWAQVNGRNAISWDDKFKFDVWYVEHQSFLLDMKIIWLTFLKVLNGSDVNQSQVMTMEKFTGNKKK
jgi:lipopolysaccharide/colanic/teichoic acid biosynthesis glycosyltransferase